MMATPANRQILAAADLLADHAASAGGNDLIIAVRAESREAAEAALAEARAQLDRPRAAAGEVAARRPRTLRAALKAAPDARLALISVPGEFAAAEARKALRRGLHVMIFSDNVPLAEERRAQGGGQTALPPRHGAGLRNRHHQRCAARLRQPGASRRHRRDRCLGHGHPGGDKPHQRGRRRYFACDRRGRTRPQPGGGRDQHAHGHRRAGCRSGDPSHRPHLQAAAPERCGRSAGARGAEHQALHGLLPRRGQRRAASERPLREHLARSC